MASRKAASKLSRLSYCLWSTTAVGMPSLAAICKPPASALLLMTAAIRAGHCSCRAARTMAAILLPPPEMRITMFFIARIVTRRASATKRICCNAAWGLPLAACPRFFERCRTGDRQRVPVPIGSFTRTSKRPGTALSFQPRSRPHHETHRARSRALPCRIFACSATAPARPENRAGGRRYGWCWSGIHAGHQNSCCTAWESGNFRQCGRTPAVLFAHRRNGRIKNDDPGARPPPAVRRRGKREWTAQGVAALLSTNSFFPRFDRDSRWCDVQMRARHQLTQHSQSRCLAPTRPIISCKGNVLWLLNQPECDRQRNICKNTESFTHGRRARVLTACYILLPRRTK